MGAMSDYLEAQMINATLRGTSFSAPDVEDLHLALFVGDPTDENVTDNEVKDPWYSRKATGSWTSPSVDDEGRTRTYNSSAITFDDVQEPNESEDDYSGDFDDGHYTITITHVGVYDASSGGNLLYHEALTTPKTLEEGDVISFAENAVIIRLD